MPRGDKTGPQGVGAMTGRGMGFCAGYDVPGYMNPGFNPRARGDYGFRRGMSRGFGMGGGRGWRHQYYATGLPGWARERGWYNMAFSPAPHIGFQQEMNEREEIRYLKDEAKRLNQMLEEINSRIDELSKTDDK